ncbi:hypothetical protein [Nodosilinea sp. E11]|uniref:hypothetical protein n=1 Tax=Nodosilinea sp. E11 TaxID=3037479 RepID=UPI00293416F0|nr:hypothetical protein [Nodosilinea sp. E11]WOD37391.1 hypothetical protein RRF56_02615 [Nodosilinea sp. E11]WOD37953.1 hypothetical protein RRF56_17205 [Nodosilinea sp. E11]
MDFAERLNRANGRLKAGRIRVRLQALNQKIYARGTFPPAPGSTKDAPYQQRIALGLPANPRGLSLAEEQAKAIGVALEAGRFDWGQYRGDSAESVGDWVERFKRRWRGAAITWKTDYQQPFNKLPSEAPLTLALLEQTAEKRTEEDSRSRLRACNAYRQLAEFAGLPGEGFAKLKGSYSASAVDPRALPSDEQIASWRGKIADPGWRWLFGMLATYGLRPHEVYTADLADFPTVRVHEATKTGSRFVWPLYPEWATDWELSAVTMPPLENIAGCSNAQLGTKTARAFNRLGFCQAYDLRHSFARRCLEFGYSPEFGAKLMGHSPETHCKVYRRWIDESVYRAIYDQGIERGDRPHAPA